MIVAVVAFADGAEVVTVVVDFAVGGIVDCGDGLVVVNAEGLDVLIVGPVVDILEGDIDGERVV